MKNTFFNEVSYLFSSWSDIGHRTLQEMRIWWNSKTANPIELENIPLVSKMTMEERNKSGSIDGSLSPRHKRNAVAMLELTADHQNLILMAEHKVYIRFRRSFADKSKALEERTICRAFSLLEIACRLLLAVFSSTGNNASPTNFLARHEQSLRVAFSFSIALRDLLDPLVTKIRARQHLTASLPLCPPACLPVCSPASRIFAPRLRAPFRHATSLLGGSCPAQGSMYIGSYCMRTTSFQGVWCS